MAKLVHNQASWNAGELAPTLLAREDIEQYKQGAAKLRNCIVVPHGGVKRRPGLAFQDELKKKRHYHFLQGDPQWAVGSSTLFDITADQDPDPRWMDGTDPPAAATDFLIVQQPANYDVDGTTLTSATYVLEPGVDYTFSHPHIDFSGVTIAAGDEFFITVDIDDSEYEESIPGTGLDDELKFFEMQYSNYQNYLMVCANFSVSIYRNTGTKYERQLIRSMPWLGRAVSHIEFAQSLDTAIFFHENIQTAKLVRQGSHTDWARSPLSDDLLNIPQKDFGDQFSPGSGAGRGSVEVDQVTDIMFWNFDNNGGSGTDDYTYSLYVNGEHSGPIAYMGGGADASSLTNLQNALNAMEVVGGGAVVTRRTGGANKDILTITFGGASGGKKFDLTPGADDAIGFNGTTATGEIFIHNRTDGQGEVEDVWSKYRGWPRCGTFFENRLWVAGSAWLPQSVWSSRAGNFFDFNSTEADADYGINRELNTDRVSTVYNLHIGQHFHALTSTGEFYAAISDKEGLTPENFFLRRNTERGTKDGVRSLGVNGSVISIQRFGKSVQELAYDERRQSYRVSNLAKFSPQVISNPVAISYRSAIDTNEADYLYVVNDDGTLAVFNTLPEDGVNAWSLCSTDGSFVQTEVVDTDSLFAVTRNIDGTDYTFLEMFDEGLYVDSGYRDTTAVSSTTEVAHLTGESLDILVDGTVQTQVTAGATTNFGKTATTAWQLGLPFPDVSEDSSGKTVIIETLPFSANPQQSPRGGETAVSKITVRFHESSHCYASVEGGTPAKFHFRKMDDALLDASLPVNSGMDSIQGIMGWTDESQLMLYQNQPLPLMVLSIKYVTSSNDD